jgi:hypothetical protein
VPEGARHHSPEGPSGQLRACRRADGPRIRKIKKQGTAPSSRPRRERAPWPIAQRSGPGQQPEAAPAR